MTTTQPATLAPDGASVLRAAGLRVTDSRVQVMIALAAIPHAGADAVYARVRESLPNTSRQAVYNVLGDLTRAGIVRRIEPAGQPGLFELRVGDNHHHVICTNCGVVADVDCAVGHAPCLTPSTEGGFVIAEAEVTYWGLCGDCRSGSTAQVSTNLISTKEK
ncbi:Fur family transcriptional regulator [Demequina oxidasica]|uniref:Fur family transcriptional regulator n=1 Tax=Demequina oxidasica TaxID=676199 RepID=UPI000784F7F3|nr:Fur family transcriptional regulator [Demequina oxidasica]